MNLKFCIFFITFINGETGEDYDDDEEYDELAYIDEEFFSDTNCFLSEKIEIIGENSRKGIAAFEKIYANELLIKMTDECAVCPEDILFVYPFINYIRIMATNIKLL